MLQRANGIIGVFLFEWKMKQNLFLFAETAYEAHKNE